jgi:hypothetical protein
LRMTGFGLVWFLILYSLMGFGLGWDIGLIAAFGCWAVWHMTREIRNVRETRRW